MSYKERRVRTIKALRSAIIEPEQDEGIRILGSAQDFVNGGFIFITKHSCGYCINLCDRIWDEGLKAEVPGGREDWCYVSSAEEVWEAIKQKIKRPLQAWVY